jgi:hypothetical protein
METNSGPHTAQARRIWSALIAAVVLLAGLVVWKSARKSETMSAAAASDEPQLSRAVPGTKTKVVLEIGESTPQGTLQGNLLQEKSDEIYVRTTTAVTLQSDSQTKLVMGKRADIHPGAVIHVTGTVREDHSIEAEQHVILTGYVQIQ